MPVSSPRHGCLQGRLEKDASALVASGDVEGARALLTQHSNSSAAAAVSAYRELLYVLVAKYHDGYQLQVLSPTRRSCGESGPWPSHRVADEQGFCPPLRGMIVGWWG